MEDGERDEIEGRLEENRLRYDLSAERTTC